MSSPPKVIFVFFNITFKVKNVQVLDGCVYISAFVKQPGIVCQSGKICKFFFGSKTEDNKFIKIEQILKAAGIDVQYSKNIKRIVWEKYLFVSPLASATSYYQKTFGEIMDDKKMKTLLQGLIKETEKVAKFQKVDLADDICLSSLNKIALFPHGTKYSLQMDFEKKKKTELDIFTGYVVNYAKQHGIDVPLHEKVYKALTVS